MKKLRLGILAPITCVLSGLSKYGMPGVAVGAIMLIPFLRALALICPRTLSKSMMMVSIDHSLLKSMASSKDTSKVSHLIFSFNLRAFKSPVLLQNHLKFSSNPALDF